MNGSDGRLTSPDGEAKFLHAALEKFCVRPKFPDQFFANSGIKQCKCGLARGHHGRRVSGGVQKRPRAAIQEINQLTRAANVASHRANRFAERAYLNVDASVTSEVIDCAAAIASQHAGGV